MAAKIAGGARFFAEGAKMVPGGQKEVGLPEVGLWTRSHL
jgi:hypothetical protein